MAKYRDDLASARLRVETLEAKLRERDAELEQRDAALAARDAELAELRAATERGSRFFEQDDGAAKPQRSIGLPVILTLVIVAAVVGGVAYRVVQAEDEQQASALRAAEEAERQRAAEERMVAAAQKQAAESEKERAALERALEAERAGKASGAPDATSAASGDGTLRINCMPPSTVVVDGKSLGSSPVVSHDVSPGLHVVVCAHPQRGRKSSSVSVRAGETTTVAIRVAK